MKIACCALLLITEVRPAMIVTILLFATVSSTIDWEPAPSLTPSRLPYGTAFLLRLIAQFALCAAVAVWWSTSGSVGHMREARTRIDHHLCDRKLGEAVGFLLAAKAIVRYPEMDKDGAFGEYFLVGTLTSVGIALVVGTVLRQALLP